MTSAWRSLTGAKEPAIEAMTDLDRHFAMSITRGPDVPDDWVERFVVAAAKSMPEADEDEFLQIMAIRLAGNPFVSEPMLRLIAHEFGVLAPGVGRSPRNGHGNFYVELAINRSCPADVLQAIHRALLDRLFDVGASTVASHIFTHPNATEQMRYEAACRIADACFDDHDCSNPWARLGHCPWTHAARHLLSEYSDSLHDHELRARLILAVAIG